MNKNLTAVIEKIETIQKNSARLDSVHRLFANSLRNDCRDILLLLSVISAADDEQNSRIQGYTDLLASANNDVARLTTYSAELENKIKELAQISFDQYTLFRALPYQLKYQ